MRLGLPVQSCLFGAPLAVSNGSPHSLCGFGEPGTTMHDFPLTGLVLSGGGARAAYQVGVLQALMRLRREAQGAAHGGSNPFGVIVGTSAGAINGTALACGADQFDGAVERLAEVWRNFSAEQVYRSDSLGVAGSGARWLTMMSFGWAMARLRPQSLLNNDPLQNLLREFVPMDRLPAILGRRHLHALAVTASSYSSGEHVTFYQSARPIEPWVRSQRIAVATELKHQHLLASSAIPFIFPARQLGSETDRGWYGDGSMRQSAPLSPAIHLGAKRLLVIGAGRMHEPQGRRAPEQGYPSLAQIAGHALSSIFLDALAVDIERMQRINRTLSLMPPESRKYSPLQPIEALVIAPSQRLDDLAARHVEDLPKPIRLLLRAVGVKQGEGQSEGQGAALASYLLFEAPYTRALMDLGEQDTLAQKERVLEFFGWGQAQPARAAQPAVLATGR